MKAIESENIATAEYSSGMQVSGIFSDVIVDQGHAVYLKTSGPTTLNYNNKMLEGHSKKYHKDGFGSPVGRISGTLKPTRLLNDSDLKDLGIVKGSKSKFQFESGVKIEGKFEKSVRKNGNLILLSFSDCIVKHNGKILFEPGWGIYDMAVGEQIISAYNGPADPEGYGIKYEVPKEKTHQIEYDQHAVQLHKFYHDIRMIRETGKDNGQLTDIWAKFSAEFPEDWLLSVEILELVKQLDVNSGLEEKVIEHLNQLRQQKPEIKQIVENGLSLVK
jgi:phenylalanine-4-hydroxylase